MKTLPIKFYASLVVAASALLGIFINKYTNDDIPQRTKTTRSSELDSSSTSRTQAQELGQQGQDIDLNEFCSYLPELPGFDKNKNKIIDPEEVKKYLNYKLKGLGDYLQVANHSSEVSASLNEAVGLSGYNYYPKNIRQTIDNFSKSGIEASIKLENEIARQIEARKKLQETGEGLDPFKSRGN